MILKNKIVLKNMILICKISITMMEWMCMQAPYTKICQRNKMDGCYNV